MARPLRIEYPDAWYHVMNRGRRGEDILSNDQDLCHVYGVIEGNFGNVEHQDSSLLSDA